MKLVLASASQRRIELLTKFGFQFQVHPANIVELESDVPEKTVRVNAMAKATAVVNAVSNTLVIGADTLVVYENHILGKPINFLHAYEMLNMLSGRTHQVITGVCLCSSCSSKSFSVTTDVHMRKLSAFEIWQYIKTGEPLDKAGSYGIQGIGGAFVETISGCYYNVVGLPMPRLIVELRKYGFDIFTRGDFKGEKSDL